MTRPSYDPPADASTHDCPHCGAPFPTADLRDLHVGVEHHDDWTDPERDAYEDAYHSESSALRVFRLKAVAAVVAIYFGFLFAFDVFA